MGHEAMMLEKIMRQNKIAEDNAKQMAGLSVSQDEDMGVSIGNETHYHYQGGQQSQPANGASGPASTGRLLPAAVLAALVGGPVATWWMMQDTQPPPQPTLNEPSAVVDTDTLTEVFPGFGEPRDVEAK